MPWALDAAEPDLDVPGGGGSDAPPKSEICEAESDQMFGDSPCGLRAKSFRAPSSTSWEYATELAPSTRAPNLRCVQGEAWR